MKTAPRSVLYVPASRPRMLAGAASRGADALIVDLEDALPPEDKAAARERVLSELGQGTLPRSFMLRINPPGTPWHEQDLALAALCRPERVLVPKAESPELVRMLANRFDRHGSATALMIETARGVGRARELAACHPKLEMLILGSADLRLSLGAREEGAGRSWELHALSEVLLAARMAGCAAIDSAYFALRDHAGLEAHARVARALGYDGKSCIHPDQIETVHAVYASTPEEVAWARGVLGAWREQHGERAGIVVVDGSMVEALHVILAERILARA